MIYFPGVLLWISLGSVEIKPAWEQAGHKSAGRPVRLLVVFEELDLTQALFRFFTRLIWAAKVLPFFLRHYFVSAFYFLDHALPSCADSAPTRAEVNTLAAVCLLAKWAFLG